MPRIFDVTLPLAAPYPPGPLPHDGPPAIHAGTRVAAPAAFLAGGAAVDGLPLEILLGKARVAEVLSRERVDRADLEPLDLRDDLRLLLKTRLTGPGAGGGEAQDRGAHLSEDAAVYLVQIGIKLLGFDELSVDRAGAFDGAAHRALLGAGVILVEGLDLSEVEPGEYELICLPLRVAGGDAAPARVVLRSRN